MRLGVAFPPGVQASHDDVSDDLWHHVSGWAARTGQHPDHTPLWYRMHTGQVGVNRVRRAIWMLQGRAPQTKPYLYVESTGTHPDDIVAGRYDDILGNLVRYLPGPLVVRFDQEFNGNPGGHGAGDWRTWDPKLYAAVFASVSLTMRAANPGVEMCWSPVMRRRRTWGALRQYWPSHVPPDLVGFTYYSRGPWPPSINQRTSAFRKYLRREFRRPVGITELGRQRGSGANARWLRTIHDTKGLAWATYMDMAVPDEVSSAGVMNDWRMNRRMELAWTHA
jgi:hypothetical protein